MRRTAIGVFVCVSVSLGPTLDRLDAAQVQSSVSPVPDPFSTVGLGKEVTVLLVMAPSCTVCQAEIPFYKTLLELPRMDGTAKRLVVLGIGIAPIRQELDSAKFRPHLLTSGPAATREITEFPTVIVLDAQGKRLGAWTGKLTEVQQKEIVAAISSAR